MQQPGGQTWNGGHRFQIGGRAPLAPPLATALHPPSHLRCRMRLLCSPRTSVQVSSQHPRFQKQLTVRLFRPFQKSGETVLHCPSCHVQDDESVLVAIWDIWGWVAHKSKVLPFLNRSNEILTNFISKKCNEFVLGSVGAVSRPSSTTRLFHIDFKNWFELSDELDESEEVTLAFIIIRIVTRSMECEIPLCQEFDTSQ